MTGLRRFDWEKRAHVKRFRTLSRLKIDGLTASAQILYSYSICGLMDLLELFFFILLLLQTRRFRQVPSEYLQTSITAADM